MSNGDLIRAIHASPLRLVLAVTGGGSLVVSDLLTESGASQTVLEAVAPYGERALVEFLSHRPEQFCSEKTARRMAMAAFVRALRNAENDAAKADLIGAGCTCSLASNRPKRGEHRVHWAVQSVSQTLAASVVLTKDARSRLEEERLVADLLLSTIVAFADSSRDVAALQNLLRPGETVTARRVTAPRCVQEVLFGELPACRVFPGQWQTNPPDENVAAALPRFLFPGSFDPMHRGHRRMLELVRQKYGGEGVTALEIAVRNVDKPPVDYLDLCERMASVAECPDSAGVPVWLTQFARFSEKSDFFRDTTFIVGTDTLKRIAHRLYYHYYDHVNIDTAVELAIDRITENRCGFLCFARRNEIGELETAESLDLPEKLREIASFVPSMEFCDDISSTQLRRRCN